MKNVLVVSSGCLLVYKRRWLFRLLFTVALKLRLWLYKLKLLAPKEYSSQKVKQALFPTQDSVRALPSLELCAFIDTLKAIPRNKLSQVTKWADYQDILSPVVRGPEKIYSVVYEDSKGEDNTPKVFKLQWPGLEFAKAAQGLVLYVHGDNQKTAMKNTSLLNTHFAARVSRVCSLPVYSLDLCKYESLDTRIHRYLEFYEWLTSHYGNRKLVLVGDGIGAGVIVELLKSISNLSLSMPCAAVLISPFFLKPLNKNEARDQIFNELRFSGNAARVTSEFCPLFITVGKEELLYEDALQLATVARAQGVKVSLEVHEFGVHSYPMFASYADEYVESLLRICDFITNRISQDANDDDFEELDELTIGHITPKCFLVD